MYAKMKKRIGELNRIAGIILHHGMQLSCLLLVIGLAVRLKGSLLGGDSFYLSYLSQYIVEAGVTITAISVIGGLMFDYYFKKHNTE